jgi:hypothetical protein
MSTAMFSQLFGLFAEAAGKPVNFLFSISLESPYERLF